VPNGDVDEINAPALLDNSGIDFQRLHRDGTHKIQRQARRDKFVAGHRIFGRRSNERGNRAAVQRLG
jgi:hypothetical protein